MRQVHYQTQLGQELLIGGSHDSLGRWNADRAIAMMWTPGDIWMAEVQLPAGSICFYKYVRLTTPPRGQPHPSRAGAAPRGGGAHRVSRLPSSARAWRRAARGVRHKLSRSDAAHTRLSQGGSRRARCEKEGRFENSLTS